MKKKKKIRRANPNTKARDDVLIGIINRMLEENSRAKAILKERDFISRVADQLTDGVDRRIRRTLDAELGEWRKAIAELTIKINSIKEELRQNG
jgi:hypothetical protein